MNRRQFMKLGGAGAALLAGGGAAWGRGALEGTVKTDAVDPLDFSAISPISGDRRRAVPSVCWQCVTRCATVCYTEDGRLVKIEGNPRSGSNEGRICARGQAGVNQVYNPDRLLYPLLRVGKRGEGKWKRISWDRALDLLVNGGTIAGRAVKGLKTLRDEGTPEKFLFHYGRMVGTESTILRGYFLKAYGTGSIGDHNAICIGAGGAASMLTRGGGRPWDFDKARLVLNFGSNVLEAHTNHVPMARRCANALANGLRMITFDVRLSNTAARSSEWVPVKPGTDLAVILAMCRELLEAGLYDAEFIENYTNVTVDELRAHLAENTPEWAEKISGVPAARIRAIALEYGRTKPAFCISYRGNFMHYNGVQAQRALVMLEAIAGNISEKGRAGGVYPAWKYPFPRPKGRTKALKVFEGEEGAYAYPWLNVSHQVLSMIDKGPERPEIYMVYCHNPVYSNGDCKENTRIFSDEEKVPFLVSVDVGYSETTELADLVLPDAVYLERWSCEGKPSPENVPEYCLRQPVHAPLGEARNFCDVACELAKRLGLDLGFSSAEEFVAAACEHTDAVKKSGGLEYMRTNGVWADRETQPRYGGQGRLAIKADALAKKGFSAIPAWMPIPWHRDMASDELVMTTFKVNVQTHSRTQNCKWLTEIYHENPAWINTATAAKRGIVDGDLIRVASEVGEIVTRAYVTEGVHPGVIAVAHHCGHWAYGEYASGKKGFEHRSEYDSGLIWWKRKGMHPNLIIPNRGDPISGSMCWMDTVVRVEKA